jgi:hypothetical protein
MGQFDAITLTVNSVPRSYKLAAVPSTSTPSGQKAIDLKADITDGVSYMKISHDYSKSNTGRHLVSVEDRYTDPTTGVTHVRKCHKVLQHELNDAGGEVQTEYLSDALDTWTSTAGVAASVVNGEL